MLHESAVSISDFALGALAAFWATRLLSSPTEKPRIRTWFVVEISAVGIAALLGGIAHGFLPDETQFWGALIWRATLVFVGVTGMGAMMLASFLLFRPRAVERMRFAMMIAFAIYSGIVLFEWQRFVVALVFYIPPAVLLFIAFLVRWRRGRESFATDGLIAMALTFVAAGLQHFRVSIDPVYLNNNVIYHLVQAVAVFFLYRAGMRWLTGPAQVQARAA
jgi:predicted neutral ceramidase superfamily lipid hydrolase